MRADLYTFFANSSEDKYSLFMPNGNNEIV